MTDYDPDEVRPRYFNGRRDRSDAIADGCMWFAVAVLSFIIVMALIGFGCSYFGSKC